MMSNGSSRGDLGFIPNSRQAMLSRSLMGTPSNLSKKGVSIHGISQRPSEVPKDNFATMSTVPSKVLEPTSEGMVSKRTEWLETQERRLTANVQEQRNESDKMRKQILTIEERSNDQALRLFHDSQWVYGYTKQALIGFPSEDGQIQKALETYRASKKREDMISLAEPGRWVLLSYPMEQIEVEGGNQMVMKMRTVDSETGQLGLSWALIFDDSPEGQGRTIEEFAMAPYPK